MIYAYRWDALTRAGRLRQGMRRAPTAPALAQQLQAEGLRVLAIAVDWPATARGWLQRGPRRAALAAALGYLATYLEFTGDVRKAVASAQRTSQDPRLQALWVEVGQGLERGLGVADALRAAPGIPAAVPTAVAAAERAGHLREGLAEVARHLHEEAELIRTLRRTLSYPVLLLGVGGAVSLGILGFILPQIAAAISGIATLPWLTRALLAFMAQLGWVMGAGTLAVAGVTVSLALWARREPTAFRQALWRLPLVGPLLRDAALARFLSNLALQLGQGTPLLGAVEAERRARGDPALAVLVDRVYEGLLIGQGPAAALGPPAFPDVVGEAAAQGEETGHLPQFLGQVAALLRRQTLERATRLGQTLEPLLLIGIGGLVLLIALALLLPIYGSLQSISPYHG